MKAIVQDTYGPPEALRLAEIETPGFEGGQVLVRVRAASVNPPDWVAVGGVPYIVRAAFGLRRPRTRVRGTDLAGVVEAVGPDVRRLQVGDEVFGVGRGTFAEFAVADEGHLAAKPSALTFEEAAAVPMSGLTALHALRDVAHVGPGQHVLITGAGGGIGTFAVQLAKAFGAEVTAVCSAGKADLVRLLGADEVIDYAAEDFTEGSARYDVILDNVLDHSLLRLRRVLRPGGTLVPNAGQFHKRWFASTGVIVVQAPLLSLLGRSRIRAAHESPNEADLLALGALVDEDKLRPVIGHTYALEETPEAIRAWGAGHSRGKLVVAI